VTDPYLDPPERDGAAYANASTEQPLRLPETSWCYRPRDLDVEVGPLPARSAGHVTGRSEIRSQPREWIPGHLAPVVRSDLRTRWDERKGLIRSAPSAAAATFAKSTQRWPARSTIRGVRPPRP
jgi:hypothetical protein